MFIVFLKFSSNKAQAGQWMDEHNQWIKTGMADDVFMLVGSIGDGEGGFVLANGVSRDDLENRVNADPFVEHDVVTAEITELSPKMADERLQFLLNP